MSGGENPLGFTKLLIDRREFIALSGGCVGSAAISLNTTQEIFERPNEPQQITVGLQSTARIPRSCSWPLANIASPIKRILPSEITEFLVRRPQDLLLIKVKLFNAHVIEFCSESCWCVRYRCPSCRFAKNPCQYCYQSFGNESIFRLVHDCKLVVASKPGGQAFVVFEFPPQHIAEDYVPNQEVSCTQQPASSPVPLGSGLSAGSQLAFKLPNDYRSPVDVESLLNWESLIPSVSHLAVPAAGLVDEQGLPISVGNSSPEQKTEIIIPNGLVVSPHRYMHWAHAVKPQSTVVVKSNSERTVTTEIWETKSIVSEAFRSVNSAGSDTGLSTIRAIDSFVPANESSIYVTGNNPLPEASHRDQVVQLTTGFSIAGFEPTPLDCTELRLSSIGGTIKAKGEWPHDTPNRPGTVTKYEQQTVQGRDQYVRVDTYYYGYPIPVVVILIQERIRKFLPVRRGHHSGIGAIILERWFSKHVPLSEFSEMPDGLRKIGRRWPFTKVEFNWPDKTELKRPVDVATLKTGYDNINSCWMVPKCGQNPIPIEVSVTDLHGKRKTLEDPVRLLLIRPEIARKNDGALKAILKQYHDKIVDNKPVSKLDLGGQEIGLAKPVPVVKEPSKKSHVDRTSFPIESLHLGSELAEKSWTRNPDRFPNLGDLDDEFVPDQFLDGWDDVAYFPVISELNVRFREAEGYAKGNQNISTRVAWNPIYNTVGFDGKENSGELFLDVAPKVNVAGRPLDFANDKGGGLVTPSLQIRNYSRKIGVVGGGTAAFDVAASGLTGGVSMPTSLLMANGVARVNKYQKSAFQESKFDPLQFFGAMDAKLIGGITLNQLLSAISLVGDSLGGVPQMVSEELEDIKAAVEDFSEVGQKIAQVVEIVRSFPADLDEAVELLSGGFLDKIDKVLGNPFATVTGKAQSLLLADNDTDSTISIPQTISILIDSIRTHYPNVSSDQLVDLKNKFRGDRLVRALEEPVNLILDEIKEYNPIDVLAPKDRLRELGEMIGDPQALLDGSFIEESRLLLNELGLGPLGIEAIVRNLALEFFQRVEAGLGKAIVGVQGSVDDLLKDVRDFLENTFPNAIDRGQSPATAFRLAAFEDQVNRNVVQPLQEAGKSGLSMLSEIFSEDLLTDEVQSTLKQVDQSLESVREVLNDALDFIEELLAKIPKSLSIKYDWETQLNTGPSGFPIFVGHNPFNGKKARLFMRSRLEKKLGFSKAELLSKPTANALIKLTNFQIVLVPDFEFVTVTFNQVIIESKGLKKPEVDVDIQDVTFGDSLEFVQEIASIFSPDSGFYQDISANGILVGYRFEVPAFSVGVFTLSELSIGVAIVLPFDGAPIGMEFSLSERANPCLLAVTIFGGTAFFRMLLQPRDRNFGGISVKELEAALEFGAVVAANLGPAKGKLYVFGGVYYGRHGDTVTFKGYVRAGGSLEVLGLITISAEFYLGLTYQKQNDSTQVYGEARISVRVKIVFVINVRVTVYYRKQFKGSPGKGPQRRTVVDAEVPSIEDSAESTPTNKTPINGEEWNEYSNQFA